MFLPGTPNPYDDEAQRTKRLDARSEDSPRHSWTLFIGGWVVIAAFGVLLLMGLPGAGVVLVPIGIGLIIGGGIPLLLNRLAS